MLQPETTLLIGLFAGGIVGYALGFLLARAIYRRDCAAL
jgi:membrane protein YqaA with SNARE-associated domain